MADITEHGVSFVATGDGDTFDHQCGGYACRHESVTGTLFPVSGSPDVLTAYFSGNKYGGWCCDGIDDADALLVESTVPGFIADPLLMRQSCEAFIYGFLNNKPGVLVWGNSD